MVLLTNLVGPGELDADLEEEVVHEAQKFGALTQFKVVEVTGAAPEESVRVFLEFANGEGATNAFTAMDGRLFGGRVVKARFFDEARWEAGALALPADLQADEDRRGDVGAPDQGLCAAADERGARRGKAREAPVGSLGAHGNNPGEHAAGHCAAQQAGHRAAQQAYLGVETFRSAGGQPWFSGFRRGFLL